MDTSPIQSQKKEVRRLIKSAGRCMSERGRNAREARKAEPEP